MKYDKTELIGLPINSIMPKESAKVHDSAVHKFFRKMETCMINRFQFKFLKSRNHIHIPCRIYVKIIPELSNDIKAGLFFIEDKNLKGYLENMNIKNYKNVFFLINIGCSCTT